MNEALGMRGIQRIGDLLEDDERAFGGQGTVLLDERLEVRPLDQPHQDVEVLVRLARVDHFDDVRMLDRRRQPPLVLESLAKRLVLRKSWRQQLESAHFPEVLVPGAIDDSHPALTNQRLDPVARNDPPDRLLLHALPEYGREVLKDKTSCWY